MRKKIILEVDESNNLWDADGAMIGSSYANNPEYEEGSSAAAEVTMMLVKQGISVDEIIKLKNQELI